MDGATAHLRRLAERLVREYELRIPTRAALVAGSAARADADFYSDLDLLLYADELPSQERFDAVREALGGTELRPLGATDHEIAEQFTVDGVACQVVYTTVAAMDEYLDTLLVRHEQVDTPLQKILLGLVEGIVLRDDGVLAVWRARAADYPEGLRRAMVETHWRLFPSWWFEPRIAVRDAVLWRTEKLLDNAFDLLGVLAGLNRVYYSRFEVKRFRELCAKLELAPPRLAERIESLVLADYAAALRELEALVDETQEVVRRELPDADVTLRRPPGAREQPWSASRTD
jgi:predicted nucleotidyltransferase